MTLQLDSPRTADELYIGRGDEVSSSRPMLTGDIYSGVEIPGVGIAHEYVMLISHPCNMRAGPRVRDRIQAIPVVPHQDVPLEDWSTGSHARFFMLPDVGLPIGACAARFDETGMVPSSGLQPDLRRCCLSERGILLLLQRQIYALSRADIGLEHLQRSIAHVIAEAELLEEWNERLVPLRTAHGTTVTAALEAEADEFDTFLGQPRTPALHEELRQEHSRPQVRRDVREEITRRASL